MLFREFYIFYELQRKESLIMFTLFQLTRDKLQKNIVWSELQIDLQMSTILVNQVHDDNQLDCLSEHLLCCYIMYRKRLTAIQ